MKLKKLVVATSIFTTASLSLAMGANNMDIIKKDNNPLGNKPYAEIGIAVNGACDYQVLLNDIPLYSGMGVINLHYPVNQYMINGSNNLAVAVQNKDVNCKVSASLEISQSGDIDNKKLISKVEFNGNPSKLTEKDADSSTKAEKLAFKDGKFDKADDGYITVSKAKLDSGNVFYGYNYDNQKRELMAGVKVSQDINLPIDLPKWAWESGEPIADNQETKDELIAIYKNIWKLIDDKEWDKLNKMFELRDKEMDLAINDGDNSTTTDDIKKDILNNYTIYKTNDSKVLQNNTFMKVFAENRLVKLSFWNGKSLLTLNKKGSGSSRYDIQFAKINGKFVIAG